MKKNLHHVRSLASVASVALFINMLKRTGPGAIVDKIRLLGWGFAVLILLSGVRHVLRAVAWRYCVGPEEGRPSLLDFFGVRLVGEGFNDMTPAGPLVGETVKVLAVSRRISAQSSTASVVIENLVYGLGAVLFMLTGVVLVLLEFATPHGFSWLAAGLVTCFLVSMLLPYWLISRRILLVGGILNRLKDTGLRWASLERYEHDLRAVEESTHDFFRSRRRLFLGVLAIEIATNFTGIGEAYLILKATAAQASVLAAYLVESASRAVQLAFAFVPLGLGVQEGVAAATLQGLGYAASEGVSLAMIRKIRTVFWAALGLLLAAKYYIVRTVEEESTT